MAFSSLFGKKEPDDKNKDKQKTRSQSAPDSKKGAVPATAPSRPPPPRTNPKNDAAHRELAKATAKKIDEIESEMSLDFMPPKPLPAKAGMKPALKPGAQPAQAVNMPSPVTKSVGGKASANPATKTRSGQTRSGQPTLSRATEGANTLPPLEMSSSLILGDSIGAMALEISASAAAPIIEEVAILYANGQGISAANALAAAIKEDQLGPSTAQAWLMLFDLYQLLNKRPEFENLALDFVGKFESSPPDWEQDTLAASAAAVAAAQSNNGGGMVTFGSILDEGMVQTLEQIKKAAARTNQIKVDLSQIKRVTGTGCAIFLKAFPALKKSGHVLVMAGVEQFVAVLLAHIQPGRREESDAPWLLLLEMYRALDKQAEFEEKGIEYCIIYEVSPPSWEGVPAYLRLSQETPAPVAVAAPAAPGEEFVLAGELQGKAEMELSKLTAYASERSLISVNCKALRRVDFAAAGTLLNMLVGLMSAGKRIEFNEVNHLVAALFAIMGIHELALINIKRT